MTVLEHRGRAAHDEIDAAFDVAIGEIRPLAVDAERVLPAQEPAVAKDLFVTCRPHGDRSYLLTSGILERDILGREVVRLDQHAFAAGGADFLSRRFGVVHSHVAVEGQDGLARVFVLAAKGDEGLALADHKSALCTCRV